MESFITKYGRLLGTNNYNIIEITLGKKIYQGIFNKCIEKDIFYYLLECLKKKKEEEEIKINCLQNKIYFSKNMELFINPNFQQRVYQTRLKDYNYYETENYDLNIKFQERKMISIENFPINKQYDLEVIRKTTSFNIKNKFYINFTENIDNENNCYYSIKILIKRKTNNKFHDLTKFIKEYIDFLEGLIKIKKNM